MLNLRRRHSRWRMFSILLLLGMICSGELMPVRVPEETPLVSSSTPRKKDIGTLSDYWQAWLLVDTQGGLQPGQDNTPRKIMPKSVFIAPVLPACAEGYHADKMGRCVKSISINATAHKDFILERLKIMFGHSQVSKNDQKKSTGPLQLNIPLVPDINFESTEIKFEETFSANQPVAAPSVSNETYVAEDKKEKSHETNLYGVKNGVTLDEEKSTFFLENINVDTGKVNRKSPPTTEFPVTELIEETNDTNFSEMDYKVLVDLKPLLNTSSVKRINASDDPVTEGSVSMTEKRENSTEMPPVLDLLISPTKLTNVVDDLSLTQNDTAEEVAQTSNFTSNASESTSIDVPLDSTTLPSTKESTSIPLDEQRDNETYAEDELAPETSKPSESQEPEFVYDEEEDDMDYPYDTDIPDEEDSAEELLKHGEAGMTIPTRDVDRHQRQRNQTADPQKTLDTRDQVIIRFNESALTRDKDEAGSNVSSEVSINGDFILETTLLDVNTERLQVTTKSPDVAEKVVKDGLEESFGKNPDIVPEVVLSEDAHGAVSASSHGRERIEQLSTKNEELEAAATSSESLLYDSPEEDPTTEEQPHVKESVLQESPKDFESNVPASSSIRTTMNFDSAEGGFVRFPDYVRQQDGYVRFPSSEANSIHSLNYKQNSHYPADDVSYGGTSTKSSVPVRQKTVFPTSDRSWKSDRLQPDHVQVTSDKQNRRPDLMPFWSKLPLFRDPAIYPMYQKDEATDDDQLPKYKLREKQSHDRSFRMRSSRRLRLFAETSPGNGVPTKKSKTPIGV